MTSLLPLITVEPLNARRPRIGYHNLLAEADATIVADELGGSGFEVDNAYDWLPHTYWKPGVTGMTYLEVTFPSAREANYLAVYGHTLGAAGGSMQLQYTTDVGPSYTWQNAHALRAFEGSECAYISFPSVMAYKWRIALAVAPDTLIACLAFGVDLQLQRGIRVGFSPPQLARDTKTSNVSSERGVFLGRSVYRIGGRSRLALDLLGEAWVRGSWLPFMKVAEQRPWFLYWNAIEYPMEAAFCWSASDLEKPTYTRPNFMKAGVDFQLRTE